MNQSISTTRGNVLAPGHGIAAALIGAQCSVNFRLISVVDGCRAGEQELENHRAPVAFRGNLGIVVQAAGIVTVEEVKLILPHHKGQLCKMLENSVFHILCRHPVVHAAKSWFSRHEQIRFPQKLPDDSAAAKVIHRRVPFISLQILGTVAPVLRQNIGLGIDRPDALPNFRP